MTEERIANGRCDEEDTDGEAGFLYIETARLLQEQRADRAHAAAREVAEQKYKRCREEHQPERGRGEHGLAFPRNRNLTLNLAFEVLGRSKSRITITITNRSTLAVSHPQPCEQRRNHQSKYSQLRHGPPPITRHLRPPACVERADTKTNARADAEEAERAPRIPGIQPRHQRRGRRMKKTSTDTRHDDARDRHRIIRREGETKKPQRIDEQTVTQQLLAAEPIRQHAHGIARQEVSDEQRRDEQGRVIHRVAPKKLLDGQIQWHQRHLVNVRESVQHRGECECTSAMVVRGRHFTFAASATVSTPNRKIFQRFILAAWRLSVSHQ